MKEHTFVYCMCVCVCVCACVCVCVCAYANVCGGRLGVNGRDGSGESVYVLSFCTTC